MRLGNFDSGPIRTMSFTVPPGWEYDLEVEDSNGGKAWTNALFTEDESSNKADAGDA